ncbi:TIGR02301 family protein [soil metagenome]
MSRLPALLLIAALALPGLPALAQDREPVQRQLLIDLSYVIGESHALRQACKGADDQYWRLRMARLIETEAPDDGLRGRLTESFNTGYVSSQSRFPSCSAQSRTAEAQVAAQGRAYSERLTAARVIPPPDKLAQTPNPR